MWFLTQYPGEAALLGFLMLLKNAIKNQTQMSGSKPGNLAGPMRFPLHWYCTARALPKYCTYVKVALTNEHCKIKSIIATALRKLSSQKRRKLGFLNTISAALNWNFLQVSWGYDVLARKGVYSSQVLIIRKFVLCNATSRCQKSTHHLVKNYAPRLMCPNTFLQFSGLYILFFL